MDELEARSLLSRREGTWPPSRQVPSLFLSDHRRISAQFTYADDRETARKLITALRDLVAHVERGDDALRASRTVAVPDPEDLQLEQVHLPRDAFFGRVEQVPADHAVGRIAAEMMTPYPPGIPAALPGERLNEAVVGYLRSGIDAGMVVPDTADSELKSVRVLVE